MTVQFEFTTELAAPLRVVFDEARSSDAHLASMRRFGERATAGTTSGPINLYETVTWRATHFFIPWKMTSQIVEFKDQYIFVDQQVRGPFKHLRHEHTFVEAGPTTLMHDFIEFSAPLGFIGRLVERLVLKRYMQQLIQHRNDYLKRSLES